MEYYLIFFIVFFAVLIIAGVAHSSRTSQEGDKQERINKSLKEVLSKANFKQSKVLYVNDYATYDKAIERKKLISIDYENQKVAFVDYEKEKILIINFNEIVNYEIYENGATSTFGGKSGILFGVFAAQSEGDCKELKLIIRLKSYENPQIVYDIISNTTLGIGISKSSKAYRDCISTMQEVVSFLEVVKNDNAQSK